MSYFFFILILVFAAIVRVPLSVSLIIFKNISPKLRDRFIFERKNFLEEECRSFKKDNLTADFCFEVSSEGELEQVRPLIEFFLQEKKRIELIFASPSVEEKCLKMAREHRQHLRVFRLPIVTHFFLFQTPGKWMSAKKLVFCRYDFFPELLLLKFFGKKFILLSATGKNLTWFKTQIYNLFDVIVAANATEATTFQKHFANKKIFSFDFRIPRILVRARTADATLGAVDELKDYLSYLNSLPQKSKLIMGSAWESDFVIFNNPSWQQDLIKGETHLLVVPHDLKPSAIQNMKNALKARFPEVPVYEISKTQNEFRAEKPGIVLLNRSGVLCELYTRFHSAYVGGGYARSIHSVLEPYLSGARVYCGPKIHRSAEYDFIRDLSPHEIDLLNNPESFYNLFKDKALTTPDLLVRKRVADEAGELMETIIKEITAC